MSKTRKTAPWFVQRARHGVIKHDHRHGECIIETESATSTPRTGCHREFPDSWWATGYCGPCGPMPKDLRRIDRKKRRAADRRAMLEARFDPDDWSDTIEVDHRHSLFGGGYWD